MDTNKEYDYTKDRGTGGRDRSGDYKFIVYPFDRYQIKVKLTANNEFVGIVEVKMNRDFLSHKQRMASKGVHDVDDFYREK